MPGTAPFLAFSLGWSGSVLLLLELWLLRDVSHCQHGVEFNTYLYFQSMAVAQQPIQMFWLEVCLQPAPQAGFCMPLRLRSTLSDQPHTLSFSAPSSSAGHITEMSKGKKCFWL